MRTKKSYPNPSDVRNEKRFRSLIEDGTIVIGLIDRDGNFTYLSPSCQRMMGFKSQQITGKSIFERIHPDDKPIALTFWEEILKKTGPLTFSPIRIQHGKGSWIWIEGVLTNLLDKSNVQAVIINFRNVTERKHRDDEIHQHTKELEALARVSSSMRVASTRTEIYKVLLEQISNLLAVQGAAIAIIDSGSSDSVIELGVGAWKDWTGMRFETGKAISDKMIATGKPYVTNDAQNDPNILYPYFVNNLAVVACVPLITSNGPLGALWMGCNTAITDESMHLLTAIADMGANAIQRQTLYESLQMQLATLKETQARLIQSEKMAAMGQLVSGVAHELNNPMTSVVLYSQLVQQGNLDEAAKHFIDIVISEAMRAGRIVRGLLDFARQRVINREEIQINEVIKNSLDLIAYELNAHNIKVDLALSPQLPKLWADPHQLIQVFVNLIQNAWQAISAEHRRGNIWIATELVPCPPQDKVRISIRDDGPGIPAEILPKIFDPFFTTKPEGFGTGLGLSICQGILAEHGGEIRVESQVGEGSTFIIELLVRETDEPQKERPDETGIETPPCKGSNILILDDEANIREVLSKALQKRGYHVDAVQNGEVGLRYILMKKYELILCDIRMPDFNGIDFYKIVESNDASAAKRIIFITGDTANKATYSFIEEHHIKYLDKPFELNDVLKIMQLENASSND